MSDGERLLTMAEVVERTGWSNRTIRRAIEERRLAVIRYRRSIRVTEAALAEFLEGNTFPALDPKPNRRRAR